MKRKVLLVVAALVMVSFFLGGTCKKKKDRVVIPKVADFTASPTSGDVPLLVAFTDASVGTITAWAWDFDNDTVVDSTVQDPTYLYSTAGTYTVKLTISRSDADFSETKTDYITVLPPLVVTVLDEYTGAAVSGATVSVGSLISEVTNASGVATLTGIDITNTVTVDKTDYEIVTITDFSGSSLTVRILKMYSPFDAITVNVVIHGLDDNDGDTGGMLFAVNGMDPIGFGYFAVSGTASVPDPVQLDIMPDVPFALTIMVQAATPMGKSGYYYSTNGISVDGTTIDATVTTVSMGDMTQISGTQTIPTFTGYTPSDNDMMIFAMTPYGAVIVGGGDWSLSTGVFDGGATDVTGATSFHVMFDLGDEASDLDIVGQWNGTYATLDTIGTNPVSFFNVVTLTAPADSATIDATGLISWNAVTGADLYVVELEDVIYHYCYTCILPGTATSFDIPSSWNLTSGRDYEWNVSVIELSDPDVTDFSYKAIMEDTLRMSSSFPRTLTIQ